MVAIFVLRLFLLIFQFLNVNDLCYQSKIQNIKNEYCEEQMLKTRTDAQNGAFKQRLKIVYDVFAWPLDTEDAKNIKILVGQ